jgi:hypothetical protein
MSSGNIDDIGGDEILAGAGPDGGTYANALSRDTDGAMNTMSSFFANDPSFRGGVEIGII